MNQIEIYLVSADGLLSACFTPPEFKEAFKVDWTQAKELAVPLKSVAATSDANVVTRKYRKMPDQIRHRRYYSYDGLECWASIRVVNFEEVLSN